MNKAVQEFASMLDAIASSDIKEELRDLTGETWTHPYFETIPKNVTFNDLRELRRLQRLVLDAPAGEHITADELALLTAGLVTSGSLTDNVPVTEARQIYKDLPRVARNRARNA